LPALVLYLVVAGLPALAAPPDACWAEATRGFAEERLAAWREAPAPVEGLPGDLTALLLGARALFDGHPVEAAVSLQVVLKMPSSPFSHLVRVALPDVLLRAGQAREARDAATDALARFPALPWRGSMLALRAAAKGALGDARGAAADLASVPPGRAASARSDRVAGCLPPDISRPAASPIPATLDAARSAFRKGEWEHALEAFDAVLERPGGAAFEREALTVQGRSLFRLGRLTEAHAAYLRLWRRYGARSGLSWALKTAFMIGNHDLGLALTRTALATTGDVVGTRLRLVEYLVTFGEYTEALRLYARHLRDQDKAGGRRPPPRSAPELWRLGWLLYRTGRAEQALAAFEACLEREPGADGRQRVRYWLARLRDDRGDRRRAERDFEQVELGPDRYYRLLAASRLAELRAGALVLVQPEPVIDRRLEGAYLLAPPVDAERLAALPRRTDQLAVDLAALPDLVEVRAARFLLEHGLVAAARDYARLIATRLQALKRSGLAGVAGFPVLPVTDWRGPTVGHWGETLKAVAGPRRERGAWLADREALRALSKAGRDLLPALAPLFAATRDEALAQRTLDPWRTLRQVAPVSTPESAGLPLAYRAAVLDAARVEGLDPFLLWAVGQRESAFDERVVSPAGAMGLYQVMPETGARLAALLGEPADTWDPTRLYDPDTAIRFGARYLALLLERFRGQEPLAIAAYNAGPHYIAAWASQKPGAPLDAFVEEIPFGENRAYVRRVIGSWVAYRERYGFANELSVTNRIDARVDSGVSF